MTHTVADAEAAIARHPTDLTQLSMAADLLIDLGDQRGEDFTACLAGDLSAEEVMRRHPADMSAMCVAAWAMAEEGCECGGAEPCEMCDGRQTVDVPDRFGIINCPNGYDADGFWVGGCRWVCNQCGTAGIGTSARAEALRLLAECGKVDCTRQYLPGPWATNVPHEWWVRALMLWGQSGGHNGIVPARLAMIDAYAQADPDTRRRWAEETRALTPTLKPTY